MFEIIFEFLLIWLLIYPGAGVRWLISRLWKSKKPFKDFVNEDGYMNGSIGLMTLGLIIALITNL